MSSKQSSAARVPSRKQSRFLIAATSRFSRGPRIDRQEQEPASPRSSVTIAFSSLINPVMSYEKGGHGTCVKISEAKKVRLGIDHSGHA